MKIMIAYPSLKSDKGVPLLSQNRQFQYFKEPTFIYPVVPAQAATMLKKAGHEVIWLYEARFADPAFYATDVLHADESGADFEVHWVPLQTFLSGEAPIYPDGTLDALTSV